MAMPEVLKNFNCFVDGRGYAGKATEVTPPKLSIKEEDHQAGGMDAPVGIDMGMEKLMLDFTLAEYNSDILKQFGVIRGGDLPVVLRGAMQRDGGTVTPIVITARGNVKEVDNGTWKAGEKPAMKVSMSLRYYKLEINGSELHEIDVENMIRIIDGVDQLSEQRAAIGL